MSNEIAISENKSLVFNSKKVDCMLRIADVMAQGVATVPAHLRGKPSDCLAIVMQASQWNMNPFVVAQSTFLVSGTLGYAAQLVNAVVQNSSAIRGAFKYDYKGEGQAVSCRVGAVINGEQEITWGPWLSASSVTTKNSPLWKTNPSQQLAYLQVKNWARLYAPGALLGVYTNEELAEVEVDNTSLLDEAIIAVNNIVDKDTQASAKSLIGHLRGSEKQKAMDAYKAKVFELKEPKKEKIVEESIAEQETETEETW